MPGLGVAGLVESLSQKPDAPVHHVARAEVVETGLRLRDGHIGQDGQGLVVEDARALHEAVVSVGGVGVHRDVGHEDRSRGIAPSTGARRCEVEVGVGLGVSGVLVLVLLGHGGEGDE